MSHLFFLGRPWPICFPWASLVLFLTLHSHGLLLNSLGFLGPIAINPLLYLLSLLWDCHVPFSLFHIIYCPWFAFFFSFRAPLSLFTPSRPICLSHGPVILYSCRLSLMGFYLFTNSFLHALLGFSFPLGIPKWPSTPI